MLPALAARPLGAAQVSQVAAALAADPVTACLVAARFEQAGMDRAALGGQFWGVAGGRDGLCFAGPNLVPLTGDAHALRLFATAFGRRGRTCASILGPASLVLPLWERLTPRWGAARDIRPDQPLLICRARRPRSRPTSRSGWCGRTRSTRTTRPRWPCSPRRSASTPGPETAVAGTGPGWPT